MKIKQPPSNCSQYELRTDFPSRRIIRLSKFFNPKVFVMNMGNKKKWTFSMFIYKNYYNIFLIQNFFITK